MDASKIETGVISPLKGGSIKFKHFLNRLTGKSEVTVPRLMRNFLKKSRFLENHLTRFDRFPGLFVPLFGLGIVRFPLDKGSFEADNKSVMRQCGIKKGKTIVRIILKPLMVPIDKFAEFLRHSSFIHSGMLPPRKGIFNGFARSRRIGRKLAP